MFFVQLKQQRHHNWQVVPLSFIPVGGFLVLRIGDLFWRIYRWTAEQYTTFYIEVQNRKFIKHDPSTGTKKMKSSPIPILITECWVRSCLGVQSACRWLSHPPGGNLPLLSARQVTSVAFTRWRQPYTWWHTSNFSSLSRAGSLSFRWWFTHNSGHPSAASRLWGWYCIHIFPQDDGTISSHQNYLLSKHIITAHEW